MVQSALTIVASKIGAGLIITFSVLVFAYGFSALALFAGYVFGYAIFYVFAKRLHEESRVANLYTMGDYYRVRFGNRVGKMVSMLSALSVFGWVLTNFIGGGKILSHYIEAPFWVSCIAVAVVVLSYVWLAGFRAVVRTDALQVVALLSILSAILFVTVSDSTESISRPIFSSIPIGEIVVFFLTGTLFPLGSAELWERVIATKSLRELRRSLAVASISYFVFGALLAWVCLNLSTQFDHVGSDTRLIVGLARSIPQYASGLVIIAFASAILSSADTFVFATSSLLGHTLRPPEIHGADRTAALVRIITLPITAIGVTLAIAFHNILDVTYFFASLTLGLGTLTLLVWLRSTISNRAIEVAVFLMVTSVTVAALVSGVSNLLPIIAIVSVMVAVLVTGIVRRQGKTL
jgi:Na+/proline symporter